MLKFLSSIKIKHSQEENIVYKLFVGFLTYAVIYYFFLKPLTIGQSFKYNLFVEWIPFIIGIVIITLLRLNFLKRLHKGFKSIIDRVFTYVLLIIMASMISYSSFGITAEAIFHIVGYNVAKNSNQIVMTLPIESVYSYRGRYKVFFYFNNNYEYFRIGNKLFRKIKEIDIDFKIYFLPLSHYAAVNNIIRNTNSSSCGTFYHQGCIFYVMHFYKASAILFTKSNENYKYRYSCTY